MDFVQYDRPREVRDIEIVIQQFADGSLKDGDGVKVRGAVHRIKDMGDFAFVIIRSPRRTFQCIWETADAAQKLSPEDWVLIDGAIAVDERSPLGFDIRISSVEKVGGAAEKLPLEISNDRKMKNLQLETLLDNRVVTLRNPRIRAIMRVADGVMYGFRQFLREEGFTEFVPPKMVMGGAEGGADMFMVKYFDQRAYLRVRSNSSGAR